MNMREIVMKYLPELFIKNIEYLVKYGGEHEIEIIMKGDKKNFYYRL